MLDALLVSGEHVASSMSQDVSEQRCLLHTTGRPRPPFTPSHCPLQQSSAFKWAEPPLSRRPGRGPGVIRALTSEWPQGFTAVDKHVWQGPVRGQETRGPVFISRGHSSELGKA